VRSRAVPGFTVLACLVSSLWRLGTHPALFWDEGWTLAVARNWVERGWVGQLLDGVPQSPGLAAQFTVVAPVALSFRLFGIGPWQGRVPDVLFTGATLWLIFHLTRRLYDTAAAWWALAVAILVAPQADFQPLIAGRQALAEMPMLCYLLAGYACFLRTVEGTLDRTREAAWTIAAIVFWALGLVVKLQGGPFFVLSLLFPIALSLLTHRRALALRFGIALVSALVLSQLIPVAETIFLNGRTQPVVLVPGLWQATALVMVPSVRLLTLEWSLQYAIPVTWGLAYVARISLVQLRSGDGFAERELVKLALTTFAATWLAWATFLSVGFPRYLFPPLLIGSMALGVLLRDGLRRIRANATSATMRVSGLVGAGVMVAFLLTSVPASVKLLGNVLFDSQPAAPTRVAEFLNTSTPSDSLIETYESELFFLLDRRYHYPPDAVHVELNRRTFLHEDVPIPYDPLEADPDYLVVGRMSRMWRLYDEVIASGTFRRVKRFEGYDVYERVRK
jgi:4-amino-4-deoxy-L-arabinose transferase-like glycosyltransferase